MHQLVTLCRKFGKKGPGKFNFDTFIGQDEHMSWWIYLFGASVFSSCHLKEHRLVMAFRALLAYTIIIGIIFMAFFSLAWGPIQERALPPVKTLHTYRLLTRNLQEIEHPIYRIFIPHRENPLPGKWEDFANVTALWRDDEGGTYQTACTPKENWGDVVYSSGIFSCPSLINPMKSLGEGITHNDLDLFLPPSDFLVTLNFTWFSATLGALGDWYDPHRRGASVMLGLTHDDNYVAGNTIPTLVFPGSHLVGGISTHVRQIVSSPLLASLGIFVPSKAFLIANIVSLSPDPSPSINRPPNIGTL
ncbi:hypothetical protein BDZ94DRAFT_1310414 [Collybia nuda]|uniref:Uncharacterized protein n=1 Tax=Collybia nuda TaxID=64659 RepID=A0A9P6CI89_9AGAR|nr:hypothetical protein BDZ94DRAFT_1310414 [Collybia nuda]